MSERTVESVRMRGGGTSAQKGRFTELYRKKTHRALKDGKEGEKFERRETV